ncbi:dihydrofolate reductase [Aurantivibrio infirmus]
MLISIIVAASTNNVIGKNNELPWRISEDLQYFKRKTMGKTIIMGRNTFDSIGKALPGRTNVVITRQKNWSAPGVKVAHSIAEAIQLSESLSLIDGNEEVIVIGGAQVYREVLAMASRVYLTRVHAQIEGDAYFPPLGSNGDEWRLISSEEFPARLPNNYDYAFEVYERVISNQT